MNLDTIEHRRKVIDDLVDKTFEMDKLFLNDGENFDDWLSNREIMSNLISLSQMFRAEEIFLDMLEAMESFPSNSVEKKIFMSMAEGALNHYIDTILFDMLQYSHNALNDWHYKTTVGKRFHRSAGKKLHELLDKYHELYFFEEDDNSDFEINFDTTQNRLITMIKFFKRGTQVDNDLRKIDTKNPDDIWNLMVIMEKLTAVIDAIRTEMLFEEALNDMLDIKDESKRTSKKFFTPFAQRSETFMKDILIRRIERLIDFANRHFDNQSVMKFQSDLSGALVTLRKKYAEIYHI